jgi:iron complex outermembrane receptor protein
MKIYFSMLLCVILSIASFAQETSVSGTVLEVSTQIPLKGTSVAVRGTNVGAVTDVNGKYILKNLNPGTFMLDVFYIGYKTISREIIIIEGSSLVENFSLAESSSMMDEVVISANRRLQKVTRAPATVNIISSEDIERYAGNPAELAARQKGVDYVRTGVLGIGLNIRGFNSAFNSKNLQVEDGRISSLIATGLPFGSFSTIIRDDVERTEIILGPNAALYGPNAHNGLISTITKDPRSSEGTTIALAGGNQKQFNVRARHAQVVSDKFAYKVWGERQQGEEFDYVDSVYVGTTAYPELELDRDFSVTRYGASTYYSLTDRSDLIASYGHSNNNSIGVTNAGRNQIKDWSIDYAQLKFVSPRLFANVYHHWSNTDDTYAMNQRTQNYVSFINNGFSDEEARARSFTEAFLPIPGAPGGGITLPRGAVFKDASRRLNAEAQYNNQIGNLLYVAGAQFQQDRADSQGTYLLDQDGAIIIDQTGLYGQLEYNVEGLDLDILLVGRYDNHELYGGNFIPKAALVKNFDFGSFRLTYGKGIAAPSILNLSGNLFGGLVLGNGEGFTLQDGTEIQALSVETIRSLETGYKGKLFGDKLFIDVNAYYNVSEDFLSPLLNVAQTDNPVVTRGGTPIADVTPGANGAFVLTYLNFGKVDTYGADLGLNYYLNDSNKLAFNYSYFNYSLDENDSANDSNRDGIVTQTDLPINTPRHKANLGYYYTGNKFFGSIFSRWVEGYDFFSGINVAAKTQDLDGDGINEIVENERVGRTFNYGPLGGFVNFDINLGYNINENLTLGATITNIFDSEVREFVASPSIGRLFLLELKYQFGQNKSNKM